jgi:hypothetical protein
MQPVERCALELLEARGNQSARSPQNRIEPVSKTDVQAVGKQMAASKFPGIADQLIERESDGRIVGSNYCTRARADDDVDGNVVGDELLKDADMTRTTQPSAA